MSNNNFIFLDNIEFNNNFPLHLPLTCERKWAPWIGGSRIFGTSVAAISMVAEMYDYQIVEIMGNCYVFHVQKQILKQTCTNYENLPNLTYLAAGIVGANVHQTCTVASAQRLVDFPLSLIGMEAEAKAKAMRDVHALNQWRQEHGITPFCSIPTTESGF